MTYSIRMDQRFKMVVVREQRGQDAARDAQGYGISICVRVGVRLIHSK